MGALGRESWAISGVREARTFRLGPGDTRAVWLTQILEAPREEARSAGMTSDPLSVSDVCDFTMVQVYLRELGMPAECCLKRRHVFSPSRTPFV